MSADALPTALQSFILRHMPSIDHVAVLLAFRGQPGLSLRAADIARQTRLDGPVVERVTRDLVSSGLVQRVRDAHQYAPPEAMLPTIDELTDMYQTRPVTLVRALYDRPASAARNFADAFRLRKSGD